MDAQGPNSEQIRYWNDAAALKWVAKQADLDLQLAPFSGAAMAPLVLTNGAAVIDVGCGCGGPTLALAERVGSSGSVLGIDISEPMLASARERAAAAGVAQARFEAADAQTHVFAPASVDALFSRFGVMFFVDPTAAFANLRVAVRSGGQLAFVCWQSLSQNPWMAVPLKAAAQHLTLPPPPNPDAPGPFAFARRERVQGLLEDAGWSGVQLDAFEPLMQLAGSRDLDAAVEFLLQLGPLGAVLREASPEALPRVRQAVHDALVPHHGPDGVRMGSAAWVVTARNP